MRILILLAFPLLATFAPPRLFAPPTRPPRPIVVFEPVRLDDRDPALRRVGRLVYLGGWKLRSDDARFGGISAMHVEGSEVTALTDAGAVAVFPLSGGGVTIRQLPRAAGAGPTKSYRDSESLAVHGTRAWIGFEASNEVWRYSRRDWRRLASAAPAGMAKWPANAGAEAMLRLPDGRFLLFSEGRSADGTSEVLLFASDPAEPSTAQRLAYRAPRGYRVTDAAVLADGGLLLLNRGFALSEGFSAKLTLLENPRLEPGAALEGTEIAHLAPPLAIDNMEALSVTSDGDRTIVWIASDDNFNPLQRTLLLKFALAP